MENTFKTNFMRESWPRYARLSSVAAWLVVHRRRAKESWSLWVDLAGFSFPRLAVLQSSEEVCIQILNALFPMVLASDVRRCAVKGMSISVTGLFYMKNSAYSNVTQHFQ